MRDEASVRATKLLERCLSAHQLAEFRQSRQFHAVGGVTGTVYRIVCNGHTSNVVGESGVYLGAQFCIHPRQGYSNGDWLPDPDIWLAQKLYIEADEVAFLSTAVMSGSGYTFVGHTAYELYARYLQQNVFHLQPPHL
jgi:hypothetical protein